MDIAGLLTFYRLIVKKESPFHAWKGDSQTNKNAPCGDSHLHRTRLPADCTKKVKYENSLCLQDSFIKSYL